MKRPSDDVVLAAQLHPLDGLAQALGHEGGSRLERCRVGQQESELAGRVHAGDVDLAAQAGGHQAGDRLEHGLAVGATAAYHEALIAVDAGEHYRERLVVARRPRRLRVEPVVEVPAAEEPGDRVDGGLPVEATAEPAMLQRDGDVIAECLQNGELRRRHAPQRAAANVEVAGRSAGHDQRHDQPSRLTGGTRLGGRRRAIARRASVSGASLATVRRDLAGPGGRAVVGLEREALERLVLAVQPDLDDRARRRAAGAR